MADLKPGSDSGADWDSPVPFAERAWHRCPSCRYDEGRGVNGSPPWHECTIDRELPYESGHGLTCNRYSPLPWARNPLPDPTTPIKASPVDDATGGGR